MRSFVLVLALVLGLAAGSRAQEQSGWRNLDGQKVPPISAKEWVNTGKEEPTSANLRGKVWLLEFFATW